MSNLFDKMDQRVANTFMSALTLINEALASKKLVLAAPIAETSEMFSGVTAKVVKKITLSVLDAAEAKRGGVLKVGELKMFIAPDVWDTVMGAAEVEAKELRLPHPTFQTVARAKLAVLRGDVSELIIDLQGGDIYRLEVAKMLREMLDKSAEPQPPIDTLTFCKEALKGLSDAEASDVISAHLAPLELRKRALTLMTALPDEERNEVFQQVVDGSEFEDRGKSIMAMLTGEERLAVFEIYCGKCGMRKTDCRCVKEA